MSSRPRSSGTVTLDSVGSAGAPPSTRRASRRVRGRCRRRRTRRVRAAVARARRAPRSRPSRRPGRRGRKRPRSRAASRMRPLRRARPIRRDLPRRRSLAKRRTSRGRARARRRGRPGRGRRRPARSTNSHASRRSRAPRSLPAPPQARTGNARSSARPGANAARGTPASRSARSSSSRRARTASTDRRASSGFHLDDDRRRPGPRRDRRDGLEGGKRHRNTRLEIEAGAVARADDDAQLGLPIALAERPVVVGAAILDRMKRSGAVVDADRERPAGTSRIAPAEAPRAGRPRTRPSRLSRARGRGSTCPTPREAAFPSPCAARP